MESDIILASASARFLSARWDGVSSSGGAMAFAKGSSSLKRGILEGITGAERVRLPEIEWVQNESQNKDSGARGFGTVTGSADKVYSNRHRGLRGPSVAFRQINP
jgi:hypothetical protein